MTPLIRDPVQTSDALSFSDFITIKCCESGLEAGGMSSISTQPKHTQVSFLKMLEEIDANMELDPIAICCDFTEYGSLEEWKQDYCYEAEDEEDDDDYALDYLRDQTLVLELSNGGLVIQSY